MMNRVLVAVAFLLPLMLSGRTASAGATPQQKCAIAKLKAAGSEAKAKIICYAKAKAKAVQVDSTCLTQAGQKFDTAVAKAGDACPGTAIDLEAEVDFVVSVLLGHVPNDGTCPSKTAKAAGQATANLLRCYAKGVTKGAAALDPCDTKTTARLGTAIQNAGACADATEIGTDIHGAASATNDLVEGSTTTTTPPTTITTSTTTSTTLHVLVDNGDGTVSDLTTGLQWEKKTNIAGLSNVDNQYAWAGCCDGVCSRANLCQPNAAAAAICAAQSGDPATPGCSECATGTCLIANLSHTYCDNLLYQAQTTVWDWINQLNGLNFAGHNDWRLPTEAGLNGPPPFCTTCDPRELETIPQLPGGGIDPIFGPNATFYWSATADTAPDGCIGIPGNCIGDPDDAFGVYFPVGVTAYPSGAVKCEAGGGFGYVRAVRTLP